MTNYIRNRVLGIIINCDITPIFCMGKCSAYESILDSNGESVRIDGEGLYEVKTEWYGGDTIYFGSLEECRKLLDDIHDFISKPDLKGCSSTLEIGIGTYKLFLEPKKKTTSKKAKQEVKDD